MELFNLITIEEALKTAKDKVNFKFSTEIVKINEADERVLARDIISEVDLPPFSRSTMDGYAVRAEDTFGASQSLPVYLEVVDKVEMGEEAGQEVAPGEAVEIATGGMLPPGADAVVMVEHTETVGDKEMEVYSSVGKGENVVLKGEDISKGEKLLTCGETLRPQDIGALAGIGVTEVYVYAKPQVTVFSTGDEIIEPGSEPAEGQIRDINSYSIGSLARKAGGRIDYGGIISDSKEKLKEKVKSSLTDSDLIVLSGGSSVGAKDLTIEVLNELGDPGVILHGVAIKPGKPTLIAVIDETLVIGLPGHPTSAMVVFEIVIKPIIKELAGFKGETLQRQVTARLSRNISSTKGREEYLRVILEEREGKLWAKPILGKSSLITTMVKADGLVKINLGREGIAEETEVKVLLF